MKKLKLFINLPLNNFEFLNNISSLFRPKIYFFAIMIMIHILYPNAGLLTIRTTVGGLMEQMGGSKEEWCFL